MCVERPKNVTHQAVPDHIPLLEIAKADVVNAGQDRLDLDLRYIKEQSMLLDIKIMWLTLARLSGKGGN